MSENKPDLYVCEYCRKKKKASIYCLSVTENFCSKRCYTQYLLGGKKDLIKDKVVK